MTAHLPTVVFSGLYSPQLESFLDLDARIEEVHVGDSRARAPSTP